MSDKIRDVLDHFVDLNLKVDELIQYLNGLRGQVPEEYRDTLELEVSADDSDLVAIAFYRRPKNEVELAQDRQSERQRRQYEIEMLEHLKKKYPDHA